MQEIIKTIFNVFFWIILCSCFATAGIIIYGIIAASYFDSKLNKDRQE